MNTKHSHLQKLSILISISIFLFIVLLGCQSGLSYEQLSSGVKIEMTEGTLFLYPMDANAIRVQFSKGREDHLPELIFSKDYPIPEFEVAELQNSLILKTQRMQVIVDKKTGSLSYADISGSVFLQEKPGSRKLISDSIMGQKCYFAEQIFESPGDELIFGLGQFQDGNYNLRGITRRLTQVNSQIALPLIYSSNGYGLLWHQYGLTDFNPADNTIILQKQHQPEEEDQVAEVTTTSGTQKVSQGQSLYTGKFSVPKDGVYSVFLNLGDMGNRHFVAIDGDPCLDQSNIWLPPTAGTLVDLEAGEHEVQVICKSDNTPELSWKLKDNTTTFRSPVTDMLDYVVFYGPSADSVISSYRELSGNAPLFPKWAYGYWQCRERYTSGEQLVETVKEFRKRKLPMDVIVQDWQYWGNRGWGVPQFDEINYPNPAKFIGEIHGLNAHFNISIWSNPDKNSDLGREYVKNERFIGDTKWLDYFNPKTREEYWQTLNMNMFDYGVDSWWMDAVEPENDALTGEMTYLGPGDFYRLTYPLMVSKAVYEGQRETSSDKRVCILTRSAFLGQQRYGIINWSGDIGGDWDAYRRQIVAGLNYSLSGMPYWTTDIGGFFRPGQNQYTDPGYHELLVRWFQWGAFNPVFRMHGYQSETEPWKYGPEVEEQMRKMLNLRYRLLPYIYSEAWKVTNEGSTIMRPLVMDFRKDSLAVQQPYVYLFGQSLLVVPVTEPGKSSVNVYLPDACGWYDFWTGKRYKGGQEVPVPAPTDQIPLFVKEGAIIPMGRTMQYAEQEPADTLTIYIYPGTDAQFDLYEDEGDNYNYEKEKYASISFSWDDEEESLSIGRVRGDFPGRIKERVFKVVRMDENNGYNSFHQMFEARLVTYSDKEMKIDLSR